MLQKEIISDIKLNGALLSSSIFFCFPVTLKTLRGNRIRIDLLKIRIRLVRLNLNSEITLHLFLISECMQKFCQRMTMMRNLILTSIQFLLRNFFILSYQCIYSNLMISSYFKSMLIGQVMIYCGPPASTDSKNKCYNGGSWKTETSISNLFIIFF